MFNFCQCLDRRVLPTSLPALSHTDITVLHSCFFVFDGWYRCESSLLPDSLYVDHNQHWERSGILFFKIVPHNQREIEMKLFYIVTALLAISCASGMVTASDLILFIVRNVNYGNWGSFWDYFLVWQNATQNRFCIPPQKWNQKTL